MRVLLDEAVPRRLRSELPEHEVSTVPEVGWAGAKNGELLRLAERSFDVLVTVDRHLPEQQNLSTVNLCVVILRARSNALTDLLPLVASLRSALTRPRPGELIVLEA